jgi:hypothetical protein
MSFSRIAGTIAAYKFIKLLSINFDEWEASKLGVIDSEGNVIKTIGLSPDQKSSYTYFHRLVRNLKRMLEKIPGGKTKLAKVATAYFLLREELISKLEMSEKELDSAFTQILEESPFSDKEIAQLKEEIETQPSITNPDGNVMGHPFFKCNSSTYHACIQGKRKTGRWQRYLGDDDRGKGIINYAKINNKSAIIIQDEGTGAYSYLRKPFGGNRWDYNV